MFGPFPLMLLSIGATLMDVFTEPTAISSDGGEGAIDDMAMLASELGEAVGDDDGEEEEELTLVRTKHGVMLAPQLTDPLTGELTLSDEEKYPDCKDKNENCTWWAEIGECEKNPGFLIQNCPKACDMCYATLPKAIRCKHDPLEESWVQSPGGLNQMFENILNNPVFQERYEVKALSTDPYILQFENFVSQKESDGIFRILNKSFEASTVVGALDDNGVIGRQTLNTRTSSNAWCNQDPCLHSPEHTAIQRRIGELTGAQDYHMEDMQVLHYETGQFYHPHHDTIGDQIPLMCGPRMLTAFIYFSDSEDGAGGETHFTRLGIRAKPMRGRMVLWPSQKDADSLIVDHRTEHEACNVTSGIKKAGNVWVHLYNYRKASHLGCAG